MRDPFDDRSRRRSPLPEQVLGPVDGPAEPVAVELGRQAVDTVRPLLLLGPTKRFEVARLEPSRAWTGGLGQRDQKDVEIAHRAEPARQPSKLLLDGRAVGSRGVLAVDLDGRPEPSGGGPEVVDRVFVDLVLDPLRTRSDRRRELPERRRGGIRP
jgi:hypothetical protein